jgi:hypothetical protein
VAEKAMWNRLDLQAKIGKPLFVESAIRALLANGQSGKPDGAPAVDADGTPPERRAIAQSDRDLETYEIWGRPVPPLQFRMPVRRTNF